jgi:acyl carrier protein
MSDAESVAATSLLSREEILARLRGVLKEVLDLESADTIQPHTRLREDLHIDSLGMLDVVIGVEEAFGIRLESDLNLFERIATVDDAVTLVQQPTRSRAPQE